MTIYAIDVSNYTSPLTVERLQEWKANGVGLVIIQAFPPSYSQFAEQQQQTATCVAAEMPFDNYVYDYLGDPTWRAGCLDGILDIAAATGARPRKVHLDEEDVQTLLHLNIPQRVAIIWDSVTDIYDRGLTRGHIYTGRWWWQGYLDDSTEFSPYIGLWDSDFDELPDTEQSWTPYGGWTERRIKQFRGTSVFAGVSGVDVNVLSAEEAAELTGDQEEDMEQVGRLRAALERVVNRVQIEDERKTAAGKPAPIRRTILREIGSEAFQALQQPA